MILAKYHYRGACHPLDFMHRLLREQNRGPSFPSTAAAAVAADYATAEPLAELGWKAGSGQNGGAASFGG